jgi:cell wall-associated NlpC family hydrolase
VQNGRTRRHARIAGVVALTLAAALVPLAGYAEPRPTLTQVRERVDSLEHQAEGAAERYNEARTSLAAAEQTLSGADRDVARQERRLHAVSRSIGGYAAMLYRQSGMNLSLQVLLAASPEEFLAGTAMADAYSTQQVAALRAVAAQRQVLAEREADAAAQLAAVTDLEATVRAEKASIDTKVREAQRLLASLEAEERARLERERQRAQARAVAAARAASRAIAARAAAATAASTAGTTTPSPATPTRTTGSTRSATPVSGRAAAAVQFALAQVGKPYVYGGAGPDSYDCSGLTMAAWARAGVSLPHGARAQLAGGTPISTSQLQPGDLITYYSPIQHIGMYIGGGRIVHAANPRTDVNVAPVDSMPITQAVRVG